MRTIPLQSAIAPTLSSRDIVDAVARLINRNDDQDDESVILDFSGVTFVSRSAADELLKLQQQYRARWHTEHVSFTNVSTDVSQVLQLVEKQQRTTTRSAPALHAVDIQEFSKA